MPDTSGLSWRTPFAFYDPDSSCWRTSQGTFLSGSDEFSETWPPSGMTRGGCAYELPMWEHPTGGRGSSLLLKTPTAQLAVNGGSQHPNKRKAGGHGPTLADEVEHLLPTPTAYGSNQSASEGAVVRPSLDQVARTALLPTPRATRGGSATETTYLLDGKERNGASTDLPLADGLQPWDVPLPLPPSPDATGSLDCLPDSWSG